jgi:hypothetical protein
MKADRVRELVAQQRAIESRPPQLEGNTRLGDVVVAVVSVPVLVYAIIDTAIKVFM